jgi:hypothetical protein
MIDRRKSFFKSSVIALTLLHFIKNQKSKRGQERPEQVPQIYSNLIENVAL